MLHLKFALNLEHLADEMIKEISKVWTDPFNAPDRTVPSYMFFSGMQCTQSKKSTRRMEKQAVQGKRIAVKSSGHRTVCCTASDDVLYL